MNAVVERLNGLMVRDCMARDVVRVSQRQHMAEAADLMVRHELSSTPVVDEEGVCTGILSAADFLRRDAALAVASQAPHRARPAWTPDDVAGTYMSTGVQTVAPTTPLLQAARIMCSQHVHRLPVLDHHGKPIGMLSTMDVVAALLHVLSEESGEPIAAP